MRAEVAEALLRRFDELEMRGRVPGADTDALLLSMAVLELADGELRDMLSDGDRRLLARALEALACGCAVVRPAPGAGG